MPWPVWPIAILVVLSSAGSAAAESGADAWLRYPYISDAAVRRQYEFVPGTVAALGDSPVLQAARDELVRGLSSMLGRQLKAGDAAAASGIVIGVIERIRERFPQLQPPRTPGVDGFWIMSPAAGASRSIVITGHDDRGVLYGTFALLRRVALHQPLAGVNDVETPSAPLRWVNEWNNLDGSIERGYGGRSIFFESGHVAADLARAGGYARLLASVGINACAVNNVNADPAVLTSAFAPDLVRLAGVFRPWGVRLALAVDFSSPQRIGGLDTFDPLDARVAAFWTERADALYRAVPDFAGFVVKADSEGRLGPSAYGRTHADAANVIARALAPHGGVLFYRGFVYDHHMDWRNPANDRARAAYDNFHDLDGRFADNVILQIKHGPIDFQVREPPSPLFAALARTNQAIELQITQEYTGQQRHICFLVPMWKEALDFDMRVRGRAPVKALVTGRTFARPLGGFVGVSNVGESRNWLGHDLAVANLYGFGRLAWDPDLSPARIADEWTRLTFDHDHRVVDTVAGILLESWPAYERYTGPLGAGTLTDILGPHYGPGIESSERNGWGQWHRADSAGIGMDRTVASGTKFIAQYPPDVAAMYESLGTCPDELLLFMHHVPYTHRLKSGKTVIQHIYDAHYEGAEEAAAFVERWRKLADLIDADRYRAVLDKLEYQSGHATVWRDAVVSWFLRESGIPDGRGRAGHYPGRIEAESMDLEGYMPQTVTPWETASGGHAVRCAGAPQCAATTRFDGGDGTYTIAVLFFDESDGRSQFRVLVGDREIGRWQADADFPSPEPNGHTATRYVVRTVTLHRGDAIRVEGTPDQGERAALDYIEIWN